MSRLVQNAPHPALVPLHLSASAPLAGFELLPAQVPDVAHDGLEVLAVDAVRVGAADADGGLLVLGLGLALRAEGVGLVAEGAGLLRELHKRAADGPEVGRLRRGLAEDVDVPVLGEAAHARQREGAPVGIGRGAVVGGGVGVDIGSAATFGADRERERQEAIGGSGVTGGQDLGELGVRGGFGRVVTVVRCCMREKEECGHEGEDYAVHELHCGGL